MISATLTELRNSILSGTTSAQNVAQKLLDRTKRHDPKVGAFISLDDSHIINQAQALDKRLLSLSASPRGRLSGVPIAIKDNIHVEGQKTTCGSKMLKDFVAPFNATVIERLLQEGAILFGKTNLDEFAMGSSTENSCFFPTRNPWNLDCVPGGSSGGSAACVAAGFVPASLGSDTGGSIRLPASFCGVIGFKPTYGMVSRYGLVAFGSSLDQIGPFTRSCLDTAILMDCIAGHDPKDSTSAERKKPSFEATVNSGMKRVRIGMPCEYFEEGLDAKVKVVIESAIKRLQDLGASVVPVRLPHTKYVIPTYYIIATAEASSNLARYDGVHYGHRADHSKDLIDLFSKSRAESFGDEVKRRIMLGTYALSSGYYDAYYLRAQKVRSLIARDFTDAFSSVDLIVSPVSPSVAFRSGERVQNPLAMYLTDIYTIGANLAGIPAISLPVGMADGLPVGLQIMGRHFEDAELLAVSYELEKSLSSGPWVAPL